MRIQRRTARSLLLLGTSVAATVAALAAAPRNEPAAVLVQVSGQVAVQRGSQTTAAAVGTALESGDRLNVSAGGRAVIMYRTGRFQTATAPTLIEARQSDQPSGLFRETLKTMQQVATTDAARQPNRQGMIRPIPGQAAGIAPRNGIAVLDARPTFHWFSVEGGPSYTVQVQRMDVPGIAPARFEAGRDTVWSYPASAPPLVPGASYRWSIAANGRVGMPQEFRVVSGADYAALAEALADLTAAGSDPGGDGLFVVALRFRDAGLFYEAERALRAMHGNGSGSGRAFHLLRGEVLDRIGDLEGASASFQAADRESSL
jgi:hypothetical protein